MGKYYIGIDPGTKGFITVNHDGALEFLSLEESDLYKQSEFFADVKKRATQDGCIAVMEDVAAIFGSSAKSTFNFGMNKGQLLALLCANHIPYTMVKPKVWQTEIWSNADKVWKTEKRKDKDIKVVDPKPTTINAIKRLFPDVDLRRNPRCTNISEDKCDSMAICEYARRKNL